MEDFEHLTNEELEAQLDEDIVLELKARDEAAYAEGVWRGKKFMTEIIIDRISDQVNELNRRNNNA